MTQIGALMMLSLGSLAQAGEIVLEQSGHLRRDDQTLPAGEHADVYPVHLDRGDRIVIDMTSSKLNAYIAVLSPSEQSYGNDNASDDSTDARLELVAEESGTHLIYATSKAPEERGRYHITAELDTSYKAPSAESRDPTITPFPASGTASGTLGSGDYTLPNGEWADRYSVEVTAGQRITVEMRSQDADTFLVLLSPSQQQLQNDDWQDSDQHSRIEHVAEESGTWLVYATTYREGQGGDYTLRYSATAAAADTDTDQPTRWQGSLDAKDDTIPTGEFVQTFTVDGQAGEHWVVDLRSSSFDPFLIVRSPSGEQLQNDDFEGDRARALLDLELAETGTYTLAVTTDQPGERGPFDLTLRRGDAREVETSDSRHQGTLAAGDYTLDSGEWYDVYTFEGLPGQHADITLDGDFDTYLLLVGPSSFKEENDDGDSSRDSRIDAVLSEAGTYRVIVTSYKPGQGGGYDLGIDVGAAGADVEEQRDVSALVAGQQTTGRLQDGDLTLSSGEWQDRYTLQLEAGQAASVTMHSEQFDTYIGVQLPDGSVLENDDWQGSSQTARIDLVAPESGRYRVIATSYRPGDGGDYTLDAQRNKPSSGADVPHAHTGQDGEIYGVFVGISDYPDDGPGDLDFTAEDARAMSAGLQQIGMPAANASVLTDRAATQGAFLQALRQQGQRMTDQDLLVVFYSGHGGRQARGSAQAADPDGYDETLMLYDQELTDDALAAAFDQIEHGRVLLVLDSCFSGGFSKDVISQPDRMGLFSSHEDVTSAVAEKFRAGGYLAKFMVEAIGERRADTDRDNALTSLELSQYLYERYRSDVTGDQPSSRKRDDGAYDDIVLIERNLGYQQLIVDRGSIGPSQVLFTW